MSGGFETMTKPALFYWDSCVFISCIQSDPKRFAVLEAIVEEAKSGKVIVVASTMAVAEIVKLSDDSAKWKAELAKIHAFLDNDFIEIIDVTKEIAKRAAEICGDSGLKPPDAIHVATAIRYGCRCLQTYDGENRSAGKKRYLLDYDGKIGSPPLSIRLPKTLGPAESMSLFAAPVPAASPPPSPSLALSFWWMGDRARRQKQHPLRKQSPLARPNYMPTRFS